MSLMLKSLTGVLVVIFLLTILILSISKKTLSDNQSATPFECGFNPMSYSRLPFSMHFFMIAVIFLIFDIEIIIILPLIITIKTSMLSYWLLTSTMFTLILLTGLLHEWINGMISWTK